MSGGGRITEAAMADINLHKFDKRLQRIDKRHRRLCCGYVTSVNHDGLIIARPRPQEKRFPWVGLALIVAGMLVFKGVLFAHLGQEAYNANVSKLSDGTVVEKFGAYIMAADPISEWVARNILSNQG